MDRRGTKAEARAYLEFLYSRDAQEIIAKHGYRPIDPDVLREHARSLPPMELFSVTTVAKDWEDAAQRFFSEDGVFNSLSTVSRR